MIGLIRADSRAIPLKNESIQCVVTSPPYWNLRDYNGTGQWIDGDKNCDHLAPPRGGRNPETAAKQLTNVGTLNYQFAQQCNKCGAHRVDNQIGLESTPSEYIETMVGVFREIRRVLRKDGVVWLNMGDCYGGSKSGGRNDTVTMYGVNSQHLAANGRRLNIDSECKPKDLMGMPWRLALALQSDGWWLRSEITWCKKNPMTESVTDRPTSATEKVFLLTKNANYFYDHKAVRESAVNTNIVPEYRNMRNYWILASEPFSQAHFATFPTKLVEPCILAGSRLNDIVLDPFAGSGTVGVVCKKFNRKFVGLDLSMDYINMARNRIDPTFKFKKIIGKR